MQLGSFIWLSPLSFCSVYTSEKQIEEKYVVVCKLRTECHGSALDGCAKTLIENVKQMRSVGSSAAGHGRHLAACGASETQGQPTLPGPGYKDTQAPTPAGAQGDGGRERRKGTVTEGGRERGNSFVCFPDTRCGCFWCCGGWLVSRAEEEGKESYNGSGVEGRYQELICMFLEVLCNS